MGSACCTVLYMHRSAYCQSVLLYFMGYSCLLITLLHASSAKSIALIVSFVCAVYKPTCCLECSAQRHALYLYIRGLAKAVAHVWDTSYVVAILNLLAQSASRGGEVQHALQDACSCYHMLPLQNIHFLSA